MVDFIIFRVFPFVAILLSVFMTYALASMIFSDKIELVEAEWECTQSETRLMPVLIGKIVMQQPRRVCVNYRRK